MLEEAELSSETLQAGGDQKRRLNQPSLKSSKC